MAVVIQLRPDETKRSNRGRPRKWPNGKPPSRACDVRHYEEVEAHCRSVPRKDLSDIKERVAHRADIDRLSPAAKAVLNFYLRHLNWGEGCDWHSNAAIAESKALSERSVERGRKELRERGYIVSRPIPLGRSLPGLTRQQQARKPWQTTLAVIREVRTSEETTTRQKNASDPTENVPDARQKMSKLPDKIVGQTLKEEQLKVTPKCEVAKRSRSRGARIRLEPSAELDPDSPAMAIALKAGLSEGEAFHAFSRLRNWAVEQNKSWPTMDALLARWGTWVREDSARSKKTYARASAADLANSAFEIFEGATP
ncbi:helix-turn-helix domain-containing protein [Hyphomicrobium sp. D-2]|uniref:helix-turn-helix domain-containing protein n=1 Tax=Hyphomicrobium sp. D-2 TaxID=3041621 RepID=UPI0024561FE8|nr:helix-turn-helix domain-containing protein [Hyphomicrobium sp. D-2]MDH4981237.1 helix-turn-helix domain-containing protein [Hyphomicrobium sp. D-2]